MQRRQTFLITGKIFGLSSWHLPTTTTRAMQAARRGSGSGLQNAVGLLLSWDGVENCIQGVQGVQAQHHNISQMIMLVEHCVRRSAGVWPAAGLCCLLPD